MITFGRSPLVKEIIYTTGFLLDYNYFNKYCKMLATDLSKHQALDFDPKAIQQINFTANPDRDGNTTIFFIIEEVKETVWDFSQGTVKVLWIYFILFYFDIISI